MTGAGQLTKKWVNIVLAIMFTATVCTNLFTVSSDAYLEDEVVYEGIVAVEDNLCIEEETEGGCGMEGDDDVSDVIDLGFNFDFYGYTYNQIHLNTNGVMHFGCPSDEYSNETLPSTFDTECDVDPETAIEGSTAAVAILPFWDDIITTPKDVYCDAYDEEDVCTSYSWDDNFATIYYRTIGEEGSRKFIAQWTNMHLYDNPNIPLGTFQVILYEGSNEAQMQYRNLLGDPDRAQGSSATIGIQKDTSNFTEYSYEASTPITPGTAIRIMLGEGYYFDDEAEYDAVYLSAPGAPTEPNLITPANGATSAARKPNLSWSTSTNATAYTLTLASDSDFNDIVLQKTGLTTTNYVITNPEILDENTTYYWSVRAENNIGQEYSSIFSFTTGTTIEEPIDEEEEEPVDDDNDDDDGIPNIEEGAAPNEGDANDDGTPDSEQPHVSSFVDTVTGEYVTVELDSACSLTELSTEAESSNTVKDSGYTYTSGLVRFAADCGTPGYTTTAKVFVYGTTKDAYVLRKHNPTNNAYFTVTNAVITDGTIGDKQVVWATYEITDGTSLDIDGETNGIIIDPVGLALQAVGVPNTGFSR